MFTSDAEMDISTWESNPLLWPAPVGWWRKNNFFLTTRKEPQFSSNSDSNAAYVEGLPELFTANKCSNQLLVQNCMMWFELCKVSPAMMTG